MSNPPPPFPLVPDDPDADDLPTREVDGEREIDPDADASQVNSADADRLAAEGD